MFLGMDILYGKNISRGRNNKKEQVLKMLEQTLSEVYTKFKIHFYQEMFKKLNSRETSLTTVELFCVEIIYALKNPTVAEFANFINVSSPNAAYKVNSLIQKGYIEKVQSETDRREYHLHVTEKYYNYFNLSQKYVSTVVERAQEYFSAEQVEILDGILRDMSLELMREVAIPPVEVN